MFKNLCQMVGISVDECITCKHVSLKITQQIPKKIQILSHKWSTFYCHLHNCKPKNVATDPIMESKIFELTFLNYGMKPKNKHWKWAKTSSQEIGETQKQRSFFVE